MGESPSGCCGWCWGGLSRPFRWRGSPNPDITAAEVSATHNPLEGTAPLEGRLPPELSYALESNLRAVPDTSRRLSNNLRLRLDEKRSVQAAQRLRAPSSWHDEDNDDLMVDVYRRAGMSAGMQLSQHQGRTTHAHISGALSAAALVCGSDVADADVLEPRVVEVQLSDESLSQGDSQDDDAREGEDTVLTSSPGMTALFGPPRGGHSSAPSTTFSPQPPVAPLTSSRSPKVASPASACLDDEEPRAGVTVVGGAAEETLHRMREAAAVSWLEPEEEVDLEDEEMAEGRVQ